jgi:hypothetical protein
MSLKRTTKEGRGDTHISKAQQLKNAQKQAAKVEDELKAALSLINAMTNNPKEEE